VGCALAGKSKFSDYTGLLWDSKEKPNKACFHVIQVRFLQRYEDINEHLKQGFYPSVVDCRV
jgi:hypothetical protein